jgi:hypothetical protein
MCRHSLQSVCLLTAVVWLAGCQMTPSPGLVSCPLPAVEQTTRLLEIAPLGTPRDEVMKRLKDAGVRGNYGQNESIFYCDVWERSETERWHINVVLMFDNEGKLYRTRPELSDTGMVDPAPVQVIDPIFDQIQQAPTTR